MSGIQQMLMAGGTFVRLASNDGPLWSGGLSRGFGYKVGSDGNLYFGSWFDYSGTGSWAADAIYSVDSAWTNGIPSAYEVRCTVDSGTTPSGSATGSWLSCATTREWYITDTVAGGGAVTTATTIEIRDAITLTVLATASFDVSVERTY